MRLVRALDAMAVLVAAALCALACKSALIVAIPVAVTLVATVISRAGIRADTNAQLAASLVTGAIPAYIASNVLERTPPFGVLEPIPGAVAVALLGASAVRPAFALQRNAGLANTGLLLCALVTAGQSRMGPSFALLCALAATLSLSARALERKPSNSGGSWVRRDVIALVATALFAASMTALAGWGLPLAHKWAMRRMFNRLEFGRAESGLSDRMSLGAMDGVLQSDTVVLRVRGRRTDYLRGAVFDRYRLGAWSYTGSEARSPVPFESRPHTMLDGETEVRRLAGPPGWMFAPLGATHFATNEAQLEALSSGALRTQGDGDVLWFRAGAQGAAPIAEPTAMDRDVPRILRGTLTSLVREWGCETGEPAARVRCIESRLRRGYTYSLQVPPSPRREPLAAFLVQHRRGHCEYFASALALLSRAADVPARVVAGYRVSERSEWGEYWTVRERNAHSWVEAHVGADGWQRFDATPASLDEAAAQHRVAPWRAALEALRWRLVDAFDQVRSRGLLPWAIAALAVVLGASVLRRNVRALFTARRAQSDHEAPAAELLTLLAALERFELRRGRAETLEHLAERVASSAIDAELAREVREALLAYANERYGAEVTERTRAALAQSASRVRRAA
ncbi:MAG: transglutaminaseTgpA domain-containing protein [Polyangiales bacterium]